MRGLFTTLLYKNRYYRYPPNPTWRLSAKAPETLSFSKTMAIHAYRSWELLLMDRTLCLSFCLTPCTFALLVVAASWSTFFQGSWMYKKKNWFFFSTKCWRQTIYKDGYLSQILLGFCLGLVKVSREMTS